MLEGSADSGRQALSIPGAQLPIWSTKLSDLGTQLPILSTKLSDLGAQLSPFQALSSLL